MAACFADATVEIPAGTLTLSHKRSDVALKQMMMQVGCFNNTSQQINFERLTMMARDENSGQLELINSGVRF